MFQRLGACVHLLPLVHTAALDVFGVDRDFHFEHVHHVVRLGKLLHAFGDDFRLPGGERYAFLVATGGVVSDEFEEKGDLVGGALGPDTHRSCTDRAGN